MIGSQTSTTALNQGYLVQAMSSINKFNYGCNFPYCSYPQIGQISLLNTEILNFSGDCSTAALGVSVLSLY